jgi:hypothetical protein
MVVGRSELNMLVLCDWCHHNSSTLLVMVYVKIKLVTACEGTILLDYFDSVPFPLILAEMGMLLCVSFDNRGIAPWVYLSELHSETGNLDAL